MRLGSVAAVVCLLLLGASSAFAHAPSKVDLEFNLDNQVLTVNISHQVKDAVKHHVNQVTVDLNGKVVIKQDLLAQEGLASEMLVYRLTDAGVGDTIAVTATCSISGKTTASIKIAPPDKAEK